MKKIGFCIDSLEMGGAEKLLVNLINLLYESGKYKIFLLTKNESNSFLFHKIKNKVIHSFLISSAQEKKLKKYSKFGNLFISLIKKRNFKMFNKDLDILIDFLDCDFYKYFKNVKNKEKIVFLHSSFKKLLEDKKIDKKLEFYPKVVSVSKGLSKEIKNYKLKNKKIYELLNFVDYDEIDKNLLENLEINYEFFCSVCRLDENHKDVETLIKAFSLYKGKEKLVIIGDGPDRRNLEDLVLKLGIEERVKFLGTKENPYIWMKKSKAFILSSKREGFGLVLVEALYCGVKVISSNCPVGPQEILLNGEIGELFEVGNIEELLEKLNTISEKKYNHQKINNNLEKYSKNNYLSNFEKILK